MNFWSYEIKRPGEQHKTYITLCQYHLHVMHSILIREVFSVGVLVLWFNFVTVLTLESDQ